MSSNTSALKSEPVSAIEDLRQRFSHLRPFQESELIIGLIAPIGTDPESVRRILRERLETAGYQVFEIRLTQTAIPQLVDVQIRDDNYASRVTALMDAGDTARRESGDNGILALGAAKQIGVHREWRKHNLPDSNAKSAYIVSSLKHPAEVETLRMIYPEGFYLIAIHEDAERRLERLVEVKRVDPEIARSLMTRDEDGHQKHGQKVADTFYLADFFVRVDGSDDRLRNSLWRIVDLLFGHPHLTPTFDEYAMFMAFTASLRSADLSRQVGAVVASNNQVIASGANDCPSFGGGLYWPSVNPQTGEVEDFEKGRDFTRGQDSNAIARREIMDDVIHEASKLTDDSEKFRAFVGSIRKGRIRDITEYGRVVHAEMEALLSCARIRISPKDATLYSTTFPCHNCAKHIIAAGIKRVVFIEPYPKSKAFSFHDEAIALGFQADGPELPKVHFEPFVGVGPRRFFDLFSTRLGSGGPIDRKDEEGLSVKFRLENAKLRLQMLPSSYLTVEQEATKAFEAYIAKSRGTPNVSAAANPA